MFWIGILNLILADRGSPESWSKCLLWSPSQKSAEHISMFLINFNPLHDADGALKSLGHDRRYS